MVRILEPGGTLYLAVPVGRPRVAFNANRVFDPAQLVSLAQSLGLQLKDFHWHTETQGMRCMEPTASNFAHIAGLPYGLGLFVLVKSD
jgi:hypothetical protein